MRLDKLHTLSLLVGWEQRTPASSVWRQLCLAHGNRAHSINVFSVPLQPNSSSQIGPLPGPKLPLFAGWAGPFKFNIRQMTWFPENQNEQLVIQIKMQLSTVASSGPKSSSQTVPQIPFWRNSTRPDSESGPSANRTSSSDCNDQ
jgi:hypothetical protein